MATPSLQDRLQNLKTDELRELLRLATALEKRMHLAGPQTDDELHLWIRDHLKVDIPRVSVCSGHQSPFEFIADLYFERELAAIAMANRGGAKTFACAILHVLNSKFRPGCESASVGAIEAQARRAYAHVQSLLKIEGGVGMPEDNPDIITSIQSGTIWKNGSRLEILGGTKNAVNGPHPQKVHFDEVELADPEVFDESRNMSQSKAGIMAQDFITSTRKRSHGPMQAIIDEIEHANREGLSPPYKLYTWCVFECAAPVSNCQVAHPTLPDDKKCDCHRVVKGQWEDGSPRRFVDVCKGRLAKSSGWIPLHDVHKTFKLDSQDVWEAQQECVKPSTEGLVIPQFARERQGVRNFDPDTANGPIYQAVDFGGTNEHGVGWFQHLSVEVEATGYHGQKVRLKEGTIVLFDEIYIKEIGNNRLADLVVEREAWWKRKRRSFHVRRRFPDPQAKAARLDWAAHKPPLNTSFVATRDIKEHIKRCKELVEDDLFAVDVNRCPNFCAEIETWHYPRKRPGMVDDPELPVDDFNHMISAFRYAIANIFQLQRRQRRGKQSVPVSSGKRHQTADIAKRVQQMPVPAGPGRFVEPKKAQSWRETIRP